jgi:hypothetical protein
VGLAPNFMPCLSKRTTYLRKYRPRSPDLSSGVIYFHPPPRGIERYLLELNRRIYSYTPDLSRCFTSWFPGSPVDCHLLKLVLPFVSQMGVTLRHTDRTRTCMSRMSPEREFKGKSFLRVHFHMSLDLNYILASTNSATL